MQVKPMPASSAAVAREVQSKPFLIHTKGTLQDKLWLEDIIWTVLSDELDSKVPGIEVGTKKKKKKKKKHKEALYIIFFHAVRFGFDC